MTSNTSGTPDYTSGFSEVYVRYQMRHTAESSAAHLLPYVRPGLRVLDFGCGPGSISVGLARAVERGELHGVDMETSQVEIARSVAEDAGQTNATFHVADVTDLPFEDGFFDIAHCHQVLTHVPDTSAVLAEVKRVLKPGGVLGCREIICESSFIYPNLGDVRQVWQLYEDLLAWDDGHPQMGKEMRGHIQRAGFTGIRLTSSFDMYSAPSEVAFTYEFLRDWVLSPEITKAAIRYGVTTAEICDRTRFALNNWKEHPEACIAPAFGEVVASKP